MVFPPTLPHQLTQKKIVPPPASSAPAAPQPNSPYRAPLCALSLHTAAAIANRERLLRASENRRERERETRKRHRYLRNEVSSSFYRTRTYRSTAAAAALCYTHGVCEASAFKGISRREREASVRSGDPQQSSNYASSAPSSACARASSFTSRLETDLIISFSQSSSFSSLFFLSVPRAKLPAVCSFSPLSLLCTCSGDSQRDQRAACMSYYTYTLEASLIAATAALLAMECAPRGGDRLLISRPLYSSARGYGCRDG